MPIQLLRQTLFVGVKPFTVAAPFLVGLIFLGQSVSAREEASNPPAEWQIWSLQKETLQKEWEQNRVWPSLSFDFYFNQRTNNDGPSMVRGFVLTQKLPWLSDQQKQAEQSQIQLSYFQKQATFWQKQKKTQILLERLRLQLMRQHIDALEAGWAQWKKIRPAIFKLLKLSLNNQILIQQAESVDQKYQWLIHQSTIQWSLTKYDLKPWDTFVYDTPISLKNLAEKVLHAHHTPTTSPEQMEAEKEIQLALLEQRYSTTRPQWEIYYNYDHETGGAGEQNRLLGVRLAFEWDQLLGRRKQWAQASLAQKQMEKRKIDDKRHRHHQAWDEAQDHLKGIIDLITEFTKKPSVGAKEITEAWQQNRLNLADAINWHFFWLDKVSFQWAALEQSFEILEHYCLELLCLDQPD